MKKIIFIKVHPPYTVCPEKEWAKREYRERWLIRQTKELGYEAKLFLLSDAKDVWTYPDSVEVSFFPVDDKRVAKQQHTSIMMLERIKQEKPDLIVFKGLAYKFSSWLLEQTNFDFSFAFIVGGNCHDKYLEKASYILAETEEQVKDNFKQFPNFIIDILPKSLDLDIFKPSQDKKFDIVNVGTFEHRKNQTKLVPLFDKYRCAFVGDGPDFLKFKNHINDNVTLFGNQNTSNVAKIISQSRIMAHPSLWEGFPRTLIESFACEVPVVALSSTISGIVKNGVHGYLVEDHEFLQTVNNLLEDENLILEMGHNCRKLATEKFGKKSTIPVLEKMYKTTVLSS